MVLLWTATVGKGTYHGAQGRLRDHLSLANHRSRFRCWSMFGPSGMRVCLSKLIHLPRSDASVVLLSNNRQRFGVVFVVPDGNFVPVWFVILNPRRR